MPQPWLLNLKGLRGPQPRCPHFVEGGWTSWEQVQWGRAPVLLLGTLEAMPLLADVIFWDFLPDLGIVTQPPGEGR